MAYNQNIPLATDALKVSQADILANFAELFTFFGVNHQNFGQVGEGKHKFLQMPEQAVAPVTAVNEAGLYSAVGAISAVTELVFRRENNGISIPFTEGVNATQGWTRLPSGLIMKWNTVLVSAVNANANVISNIPMTDPPTLITSLWGIVVAQANPGLPTIDVNAVCYVTSLASNQINYKIWRRNLANTPGTNQGPLNITGLLLGVE